MSRQLGVMLLPLAAGGLAFGTGLNAGPVSYDELARFSFGGRTLGLLLHLGVIAAVFELWRHRFGRTDEALWAALLFAVLPATSEAVLGAAGRGPQLATLLIVLGLRTHAGGGALGLPDASPDRDSGEAGAPPPRRDDAGGALPPAKSAQRRRRRSGPPENGRDWRRAGLVPLRLAIIQWLALQLHATGAALAPLLLLQDALLERRPVTESLAAAGAAGAVALGVLIGQAAPGDLGDLWRAAPFIAEGLGRALVPHTQTVAWLPEAPSLAFAAGLAAAAVFVAVGVVVVRRRWPERPAPGLFGLGWWGFATLPLVPTAVVGEAVPESGLYLAIVGPCLWLGRDAAGFLRWFRHIGRGRLAFGLLTAAIFLLTARSALRTQDWRDDFLLHLSAVEDEPYNPEALYRYGTHLAMQGERLSSARALARAYEVEPERVDVANNFAVTLVYRNEWAMAETLLRAALARAPHQPTVRRNLERVVARKRAGTTLMPP